jgi:hypothetical protein
MVWAVLTIAKIAQLFPAVRRRFVRLTLNMGDAPEAKLTFHWSDIKCVNLEAASQRVVNHGYSEP